jgi:competence protein ComGC
MIKQKLMTIFTALVILFAGVPSAIPAYASFGNTGTNFFSDLIQFVSQKFGLDQAKVKSAVTEYQNQNRQKMQQNMQDREKTRLDALVTQGKITVDQKNAIIAEQAKLRAEYNSADQKNLTADQRKQQFQKKQEEIKAWAQSQGIDASYVMPFGGRMGLSRDQEKSFGWGHKLVPTQTP